MLIVLSLSGRLFLFNILSAVYQVGNINRNYTHADEYKMEILHENDYPISIKPYTNNVTPKRIKVLNKDYNIAAKSKINIELIKKSVHEMK